jgi:hypothetical protein
LRKLRGQIKAGGKSSAIAVSKKVQTGKSPFAGSGFFLAENTNPNSGPNREASVADRDLFGFDTHPSTGFTEVHRCAEFLQQLGGQ